MTARRGPPPMRYRVKTAAGEELVVPSLRDLHDLYMHGFLADDDLVRAESAERWTRAGALPALHGVREQRVDRRKVALLVAGAIALAVGIGILTR